MERTLAQDLSRPGPGTLARFLYEWHGLAGLVDGPDLGPVVPPPLAEWYRLAGSAPCFVRRNRILGPDEIWTESERLVFYVENDGCGMWSTSDREPDPPVWWRRVDREAGWLEEGERLYMFLLQVALFESVMSAPHGASVSDIEGPDAARVLEGFMPCRLSPWSWPCWPGRLHVSDRVLAFACPNEPSGELFATSTVSLHIGARGEDDLRFLEPLVTDAWEYFSLRDREGGGPARPFA